MSIQNPFFCDRFSVNDYRTVAALRLSFGRQQFHELPHFEPILLHPGGSHWHPLQRYLICSSGVHTDREFSAQDFCTARWKFAERVYAEALNATKNRYPQVADVQWEDFLPNWRRLLFPACFSDAADFLVSEMERLSLSGSIHVETGCSLYVDPVNPKYPDITEEKGTVLQVIFDTEELSEDIMKPLWSHQVTDFDAAVPKTTVTFAWKDIADFVYRPTPEQIELINYWDARPAPREIDLKMIDKVSHLDLDGAIELIENGANVNACDQYGDTALTTLAQYIPSKDSDEKGEAAPDLNSEDRIRMMGRLIEQGANVNLFFYPESDALINATLNADSKTVSFLLEVGADPNYNPWPEDNPDDISQALDFASSDAFLERGTPEGDAYAEIEKLLKQHGAVFSRASTETTPPPSGE